MPNIKSQKKRVIIAQKENEINTAKRSRVRNAVKKYESAIANNDVATAEKLLVETISLIDRAKSDVYITIIRQAERFQDFPSNLTH